MPREGRRRSLRLASASMLAGLASASACVCILAARARADPLIAAAGDIACDTTSEFFNGGVGTPGHCRQRNTSDLLVQAGPTAVLTLGDNQYHVGSLSDFNASFDPTWGRLKPIIHPAVGNHEYATAGARGYFDYFNGVGNPSGPAGDRDKGYYSFDIGSWHLIALNSECERTARGAAANGCAAGSPQESCIAIRSRGSSELLHARLLAQPALQLRLSRQPSRDECLLGGAPRGGVPTSYSTATPTTTSASLPKTRAGIPIRRGHPRIHRRHGRGLLHELEQREAQQRGAPEHHLRGPRAHPSSNELRVAVSSRGRRDVHRLRRRCVPRSTTWVC